MRLKKIRLAGFKSFVDPTNIPFPGDMTAIVGPNGCGKSNVIDAVRWVLGESSAKNLRGDAMTDVIFNGSSARKPVSQASVELVFDNSSGRISGEYAGFNELSVKRIVTKDAISSYLLNGAKCRRRDITDLFLGTGLGPRSYAIIEQGMISRLIESKPQELRVFIEEAAGISKYKERRRETQNRITHTKDNLDRLQDVRAELSEQLAKLKRQATTATRYKELKQEERELKAQVATLRWLTQSELIKKSDELIAQYQQTLEDLFASKQGDESGLQTVKNDLSVKNQAIADIQTQIFALGNDITRLEQSQIFAKKRLGQIQHEKEQLEIAKRQLDYELDIIEQELTDVKEQIEYIEPERFTLEQTLEDIQILKLQKEAAQAESERQYKKEDDEYYQAKHQLQTLHGKLQQTLSLQQRTQDRIIDIENELDELNESAQQSISELQQKLQSAANTLEHTRCAVESHKRQCQDGQAKYEALTKKRNELDNQRYRQQAQLEALQISLSHKPIEDSLPEWMVSEHIQPLWQVFSVAQEYSACLETVIQLFKDVSVYTGTIPENAMVPTNSGLSLWFSDTFTAEKVSGTLAEVLEQERVPWIFNFIYLQDTPTLTNISSLSLDATVIAPDGTWIAKSMMFQPMSSRDSKVETAAHIRKITSTIEQLDCELASLDSQVLGAEQQLSTSHKALSLVLEQCDSAEQIFNHCDNELKLEQMRQDANRERVQKLTGELDRQREIVSQETESLEILNEQIEVVSITVAEKEELRQQRDFEKQHAARELQDIIARVNQAQSQLHQQQLRIQQVKNTLQLALENKRSKVELTNAHADKFAMLEEEAENLLMPTEEQRVRLQTMLSEKQAMTEQQTVLVAEAADLEQQIRELEQGHAGITSKIEKIKSIIEGERLQAESARIRAQGFIEQLAEMKITVRETLDTLPNDADVEEYQQRLEKVTASIQRLGAVNLAAVDEYNEQAERKAHLDAQNDDLTAALDTLEDAMRKIDRETRNRFKTTFDRVNDDLKLLFPKVFGGGSAYLALTDEDLLDTGVTIMARPPGKKNSTIQLLSGGEKALTALSLVFAIFRLNPSPFCLLDEVDAPLDDANVGRFCNLVSEMSKTVQFIYISHNKVAMEMATHLTGVTMAEPGVSRMVSVSMQEALEIAE